MQAQSCYSGASVAHSLSSISLQDYCGTISKYYIAVFEGVQKVRLVLTVCIILYYNRADLF